MAKGIRVGNDVSLLNPDLTFTSEAQSFKLSDQFKDIVRSFDTQGAAIVILTITHNLGYRPVFRLFVEAVPGSGKWYNDSNTNDLLDPAVTVYWTVLDINETTVKIYFAPTGAPTVRYKYWLFEDSLERF